jgi:phosphatidylethanolamine/phosphatidyl-N-methylethanolamine N-methyltransferase
MQSFRSDSDAQPFERGKDTITFLRSWLQRPSCVGAIAPSSNGLARLICSEIDAGCGPVLELGPGTGVFTQALLGRGLEPAQLTLIEALPEFAALLRQRYPQARVLTCDAVGLAHVALYADACAGAAVSGLPLRAMPTGVIDTIIAGVFAWLRPRACLYQFTYGLRCPIPAQVLQRHRLRAQAMGRVWRNLPPATVWRVTRRDASFACA